MGGAALPYVLGLVVAGVAAALLLVERARLGRKLALEVGARQAAEQRAAAAELAQNELMATLSHEVRTPLHAVIGTAELMLREALPAAQRERLMVVDTSAHALLSLIDDLFDLSLIETGRLPLRPQDFRLDLLIGEAVRIASPRAAAKGLRLEVDIAPGTPEALHADAARLRQVLLNLLDNALKFTSQGWVRIAARVEGWSSPGASLRLEVADSGIGIAPRLLTRLFEPFTQGDSITGTKAGGAGLGLAIGKKLVERMNGEIGVESTPGSGSLFWLRVPVAPAGEAVPEASADLPRFVPGQRLLVVEDNPVNQRVMLGQLSALGLEADAAEDGHRALDALAGGRYDAVLMDVQLPGLDGYQTTRRWRELEAGDGGLRPGGKRLAVIAVTANAIEGERERCLASGMDDFLAKPFRLAELAQVLAGWLAAAPGRLSGSAVADPAPAEGPDPVLLDPQRIEELRGLGRRTGRDLLGSLAELFGNSGADQLAELRRSFDHGDPAAVQKAAHSLKSSAGNIGASELAELAKAIEHAGRQGEIDAVRPQFERLAFQLPRVVAELSRVAGEGESPAG